MKKHQSTYPPLKKDRRLDDEALVLVKGGCDSGGPLSIPDDDDDSDSSSGG